MPQIHLNRSKPQGDIFKVGWLARAASTKQEDALPWTVNLRAVDNPNVGEETLQIGESTPRWADSISRYLKTGDLPGGGKED